MGRFINEDTYEGQIDNPLSLNLYTYVENNPLTKWDPSGHCSCQKSLTNPSNPLSYGAIASGYYGSEYTGPYVDILDDPAIPESEKVEIREQRYYAVQRYLNDSNVPDYVKQTIRVSQSNEDVASNVPDIVLKPGTKEWKEAVKNIKNGTGKGINYRTGSQEDAEKLLKDARLDLEGKETYTDEVYKKGYEIHPGEEDVGNGLPHIKWKDWSQGKSKGADGHIGVLR